MSGFLNFDKTGGQFSSFLKDAILSKKARDLISSTEISPFHCSLDQKKDWDDEERLIFKNLVRQYIDHQNKKGLAIDFSGTSFYGDMDFSGLEFEQDLYFDAADFEGGETSADITFRHCHFKGCRISFRGCRFSKVILNFEHAHFSSETSDSKTPDSETNNKKTNTVIDDIPQQFLFDKVEAKNAHLNCRHMVLRGVDIDFTDSYWLNCHIGFINAEFDSATRFIFRRTRLISSSNDNLVEAQGEYTVDLHDSYSDSGQNDIIGKVILEDLGAVHNRFIFSGRKFDRRLEIIGDCQFSKVPDFSHSDLHRLTRFPPDIFKEVNYPAAEYYEALKKIAQDDLGSKRLWSELFVLEQRCYLEKPCPRFSDWVEIKLAMLYDVTSRFGSDTSRPVCALLIGPVLFFVLYWCFLSAVVHLPWSTVQFFSADAFKLKVVATSTSNSEVQHRLLWKEALNFSFHQTFSPFSDATQAHKSAVNFNVKLHPIEIVEEGKSSQSIECSLELTHVGVQDLYNILGEQGTARSEFTKLLREYSSLNSELKSNTKTTLSDCTQLQNLAADIYRLEHASDSQYVEHFNWQGQYVVQIIGFLQSIYNITFLTVLIFTLQWRFRKSWDD